MPACPRRSNRGASAGALPPDSLGSAPPETIHVRRRPRCRSTRASTPVRRLGASAGGRPLEASNAARAQHEAHLPSVPPRRCRWPHLASTRDGSSQWSPNPLPRFAPYDTSWGSSNPGSKQSEPDIARRDRARRAASRPVLDAMRRRLHLRSVVVVLVLLALLVRIVLLARIVGDDLRGGQSGRCTIRQIRLAHTRLDQDSKA